MEMTRRSFLVALSAGALSGLTDLPLAFADEKRHNLISVANYGALPDGSDAGPGVKKAIAALPQKGGATLFFPPGRYHFKQSGGTIMDIKNIERLVVDGTGATFMYEGITHVMRVSNCEQPLIHGFTIDSDRPPFSQGQVLAVSHGGRACAIKIDPEFPVTGHEQIQAIGTSSRTALFRTKDFDGFYPVKSVSLMDSQVLHLDFRYPQTWLKVGQTLVLRYTMYDGMGISVGNCRSPRLQNVTIYSAAGLGVVGAANENLYIDRLRIQRKPGSNRLISVNSGGFQNFNGFGKIVLNNCFMEGTSDDCINVNTSYLVLLERVDARTALVRKADKSAFGEKDKPIADTLYTLLNGHTLDRMGKVKLVGCELGKEATFHFDSDLPHLQPGDLLYDNSHSSELTVSQCVFPGSRGRAVLAHNDSIIERCKFANMGNEAILLQADCRDSMEGPSIERVKIFQNEIDDCWRNYTGDSLVPVGAIRLSARVPLGSKPGFVNHDIEISSNTIRGSKTAAIVANYTERLKIANNKFENNHGPAIILNRVRRTELVNNVSMPRAKLVIDPSSKDSVELKENVGLES